MKHSQYMPRTSGSGSSVVLGSRAAAPQAQPRVSNQKFVAKLEENACFFKPCGVDFQPKDVGLVASCSCE